MACPLESLLLLLLPFAACRFFQEVTLLTRDDDAAINIDNKRFEYIWQVGRFDLFDGMTHADHVSNGIWIVADIWSVQGYGSKGPL